MAIKTISQFEAAVPADNDYILFEQNGEGKSAKFSDFSLSYEEIMATNPEPDLSGKVASANALKTYSNNMNERFQKLYSVPYLSYESLGGSTDSETYFKAWISHIFNNYKYVLGNPIVAKVNPNSDGICIGLIYNSLLLDYASFIYIPIDYNSKIYKFGYNDKTWYFVQNS